jgi:hypothetical protein
LSRSSACPRREWADRHELDAIAATLRPASLEHCSSASASARQWPSRVDCRWSAAPSRGSFSPPRSVCGCRAAIHRAVRLWWSHHALDVEAWGRYPARQHARRRRRGVRWAGCWSFLPGRPAWSVWRAKGLPGARRFARPMLRRDQRPADPDYYDMSFAAQDGGASCGARRRRGRDGARADIALGFRTRSSKRCRRRRPSAIIVPAPARRSAEGWFAMRARRRCSGADASEGHPVRAIAAARHR